MAQLVWNENYVLCPITSEARKQEGVLPVLWGVFLAFFFVVLATISQEQIFKQPKYQNQKELCENLSF